MDWCFRLFWVLALDEVTEADLWTEEKIGMLEDGYLSAPPYHSCFARDRTSIQVCYLHVYKSHHCFIDLTVAIVTNLQCAMWYQQMVTRFFSLKPHGFIDF